MTPSLEGAQEVLFKDSGVSVSNAVSLIKTPA